MLVSAMDTSPQIHEIISVYWVVDKPFYQHFIMGEDVKFILSLIINSLEYCFLEYFVTLAQNPELNTISSSLFGFHDMIFKKIINNLGSMLVSL